jgi:cytochrome c oxidase assembly protein subunit 15
MALAAETRLKRWTLDERPFRWIAYAALSTLTLIIFTGAAVRLTGSGLGCHNWPKCTSRVLPELNSHALIEYGNRLVTGVVGIPSILAAVGAYRLRPFRRELVVPALILPAGVFVEALLGGLTVLLDLQWQVVIAHYITTCMLLVAAAVLVWRLDHPADTEPVNDRRLSLATRALTYFGGAVLVAGSFATAAGPHAGGGGTGDYVERWHAYSLKTVIHWHGHAAAVLGFLAIGLWVWAWRAKASPNLRRALTAVCVLIGAQGVVGLIQYHNALPSEIVWVHASLAAVCWLAMVWSVLAAGKVAR